VTAREHQLLQRVARLELERDLARNAAANPPLAWPRHGHTLDLEGAARFCRFCDRELKGSQARVCCGRAECKAAYQSTYAVKYAKVRAERRKLLRNKVAR